MKRSTTRWFCGTLGVALALCGTAGCDAPEEIDDTLVAEDSDGEEEDDLEFRSGNDYFDPVGNHEVANCSTISGWAKDGDSADATQVHIYKGAPYPYGQIVTHVWADDYRGDLPWVDKNHGFSISTPNAFKTGCPETVYIHALDLDASGNFVPGGNNLLLSNTGKSVTCGPPPPGGCYDGPDLPDIPDIP